MDKEPRRDIDIDAANEVFSLRDTEFILNKREVCREQPIKKKYEICQKLEKNSTVHRFSLLAHKIIIPFTPSGAKLRSHSRPRNRNTKLTYSLPLCYVLRIRTRSRSLKSLSRLFDQKSRLRQKISIDCSRLSRFFCS